MTTRVLASATVMLLSVVSIVDAAPITYDVSRTIGAGSVVGSITTDGTVGVLGTANILGWNLTLTDANSSFVLNGPVNSAVLIGGSAFSATVSDLLFNFNLGSGFVLFQNPSIGSGQNFWCIDNGGCINLFVPGEYVVAGSLPDGVGQLQQGSQVIASVAGTVPEPVTVLLLGAGLAATQIRRNRHRRA
jgi:hypothetical protein